MSKITKFIENELDRVNEYLSMAKANLVVVTELCHDKCCKITKNLTEEDLKIIKYLNNELYRIELKIDETKEIIQDFKNFSFDVDNS